MFSIKKYATLVADDLRSNLRNYLLSLGAILGVIAAIVFLNVFIFNSYPSSWHHHDEVRAIEVTLFWIGLFIGGCFSAASIFSPLANKANSISYLMLPASSLEKYLSRITILVPGFFIAYCIGFEAIDLLRYIVARIIYNPPYLQLLTIDAIRFDQSFNSDMMFMTFVALQSSFVLGSAIWPKKAAMRTIIALLIIPLVLSMYGTLLGYWMIEPNYSYGWEWMDQVIDQDIDVIFYILYTVTMLINYTLAYFRFKETEIINRW